MEKWLKLLLKQTDFFLLDIPVNPSMPVLLNLECFHQIDTISLDLCSHGK